MRILTPPSTLSAAEQSRWFARRAIICSAVSVSFAIVALVLNLVA